MSTEVTTAQKQTYNAGFEMLAQQMPCKLQDKVRNESDDGDRVNFPQIGVVAANEVTTRHGDTTYVNTPHRRRWVTNRDYDVADLVDTKDLYKIVGDPGGEYAKTFMAALNRKKDKTILEAALGTAYIGQDGTSTQTLPTAQKITDSGGFTLAKVRSAGKILKAGNAVENGDELFVAWTSYQEAEFMQNTEVASVDYNNQRVLVSGGMDGKFFGFTYVRLEDWTDEQSNTYYTVNWASNVRYCVAWTKRGLLLNTPKASPPRTYFDVLPQKRHSTQVRSAGSWGATRMQESMVVQIQCDETH